MRPITAPAVRATSSPSAAPITAEHKAARLRCASIASDARRRFRKQEGMPMTDTVALRQPWYRGLNRHQWNILLAANLGWLFDGFELYALILTVGPAMRSLLDPSVSADSRLHPHGRRHHSAGLEHWRHRRRRAR